ncbi:DUF503 domain-containing protein [Candidatus Acetothermia bacterium]|nr:DUF503 domain-containing protein [Candidatus Acetothermia bacterium]MBI3643250.1 DUF503 domain-containing protein [Candidatus Acetothermia bacterium]
MLVEAAKLILRLPHTTSLKDKRRILKSLITKSQQDFRVSIAEVDQLDNFHAAVLGVAFVSNDPKLNENLIGHLLTLFEEHPEIILEDHERDYLSL